MSTNLNRIIRCHKPFVRHFTITGKLYFIREKWILLRYIDRIASIFRKIILHNTNFIISGVIEYRSIICRFYFFLHLCFFYILCRFLRCFRYICDFFRLCFRLHIFGRRRHIWHNHHSCQQQCNPLSHMFHKQNSFLYSM